MPAADDRLSALGGYRLEEQVGFHLRRAGQRHAAIFAGRITDALTPTQWAALVKLAEFDSLSQNLLGRETAMDGATIKGVVDRLAKLGLVATTADPADRRRLTVSLTGAGTELFTSRRGTALQISADTVAPLTASEAATLQALLLRLT